VNGNAPYKSLLFDAGDTGKTGVLFVASPYESQSLAAASGFPMGTLLGKLLITDTGAATVSIYDGYSAATAIGYVKLPSGGGLYLLDLDLVFNHACYLVTTGTALYLTCLFK
jgi:hypothetical protein